MIYKKLAQFSGMGHVERSHENMIWGQASSFRMRNNEAWK